VQLGFAHGGPPIFTLISREIFSKNPTFRRG
jgi:hypothetical protein